MLGALLSTIVVGCSGPGFPDEETSKDLEPKRDALYLTGLKWARGQVPVCLNDTLEQDPTQLLPSDPDFWPSVTQVRSWLDKSWARAADVHFNGWQICPADRQGRAVLTLTRNAGGVTFMDTSHRIYIGLGSFRPKGVTLHEFGHSLGFAHEWDRPDFPDGLCGKNGGSNPNGDTLGTPAGDSESIMLSTYCQNNTELSAGDIAGVRRAYGNNQTKVDFDGDGKTDIAVWRPTTGEWWIATSSGSPAGGPFQFGGGGDIPVPGDYDGDGITNKARFRAADHKWYIDGVGEVFWGDPGDIPVPADYDGDARTDVAVWRPSTGQWWITTSSGGPLNPFVWGQNGDIPVPGDYDGDDHADIAVFSPSTHTWHLAIGGTQVNLGNPGDYAVAGDYDGDRKTDVAVWRPSTGEWIIVNSSTGARDTIVWGQSGDVPVPGDYDGDGRDNIAVFRPSEHKFYIRDVNNTENTWGDPGDVALATPPH